LKVLVTGGGGFLGGAIVRLLLERGDHVRSFARSDYPGLRQLGAEVIRGDLGDSNAVTNAADGCDAIVHVAAKAGVWGSYESYHSANVIGTQHIISAAHHHKIRRLVYTSSPSVVFAGKDQENVDESAPYPEDFLAFYPHTKAIAEKAVLEANGSELATVALRPHLIWGPGDPHLVPRVLDRARAGRLRIIGEQPCLVDSVYIDNAALAHISALDRVSPGSRVAGKVYFISQGEPIPMRDLLNRILQAGGMPAEDRRVPTWLAYAGGWLLEVLYKLLQREDEPPMTRFVAKQLSTAHYFDLTAARTDLDYHPSITMDEGFIRLQEWLMKKGQSNG